MLSTDFIAFCLVLTMLCVVVIAISQFKLRDSMDRAVDFVQNHNAKSLSLRKIAEVEVSLTELTDSYQALLDSHKKLRSRIGMREKRARDKEPGNEVDLTDEAQTAAYKARLRADLRKRGML